jgi:hypothetical protein
MERPPADLAAADDGGGGSGDSAWAWDRFPLRDRPSAVSSAGVEPTMKDLTLCSTGKSTTPIAGAPQELAPTKK